MMCHTIVLPCVVPSITHFTSHPNCLYATCAESDNSTANVLAIATFVHAHLPLQLTINNESKQYSVTQLCHKTMQVDRNVCLVALL